MASVITTCENDLEKKRKKSRLLDKVIIRATQLETGKRKQSPELGAYLQIIIHVEF